jgi:hypothetical protein
MGNGQAPGIETGLGVSGAGSGAAGWVAVPADAGDLRGAVGFFLAAFFLADFRVGFFLAVACFAPRFALPRAGDLRVGWPGLARTGFFFFARALAAAALRAFFFAVAICAFSCGRRFQCSAACAWLATSR